MCRFDNEIAISTPSTKAPSRNRQNYSSQSDLSGFKAKPLHGKYVARWEPVVKDIAKVEKDLRVLIRQGNHPCLTLDKLGREHGSKHLRRLANECSHNFDVKRVLSNADLERLISLWGNLD